jgi:hypothetical protein
MVASQERASDRILVGTASRTINPPEGSLLIGFPPRRPNTGVALDVCSRVAVFGETGQDAPAAALVVLDVIGVSAELVGRMRERAAAAVPGLTPEAIMIAATHTHSGPRIIGFGKGTEEDEEATRQCQQTAIERTAGALASAWASRHKVTARVGRAEARLGHNRRVVDASGRGSNEWLDPDAIHTGYFNPAIRFVVFEDAESGAVRAVISSYGCHPVVAGPGNTKVTADYPGYVVRALESATGAEIAIHATGTAGNVNPRECLFPDPDAAEPMGKAIADEILAALPYAKPVAASPIRVAQTPLELLLTPEAAERRAERAMEGPKGLYAATEVQALRLGEMAFVSAPGELFTEIGTAMENVSPFGNTIVVSCANDIMGYLCTDAALREGGLEPSRAVSPQIEAPLVAAAKQALTDVAAM